MESSPKEQPVSVSTPLPDPSTLPTCKGGTKHYKYGKQETLVSLQTFYSMMQNAKLELQDAAYMWMLFWCGTRKSELYERVASDVRVTDDYVSIDFHKRKKHGAVTPPMKIPRAFPGTDEFIKQYERILSRPPTRKQVWDYSDGVVKIKNDKAQFLFPNIQRGKATYLVKHAMGDQYYPHFLRLNRLSFVGRDKDANIVRLRSFSGIKTIRAIEFYLGTSEEEVDAAFDFMKQKEVDQLKRVVPNIAAVHETQIEPK